MNGISFSAYDLSGKKVISIQHLESANIIIDKNIFSKGMYLFMINSETERFSQKVIVH